MVHAFILPYSSIYRCTPPCDYLPNSHLFITHRESLPLEKSSLRNRLQTFERVQRQIKTIEIRTEQIERYVSSGDFEIDSRL